MTKQHGTKSKTLTWRDEARPPQTTLVPFLEPFQRMSAWDQTVVIGRKARPGGSSNSGPRGPTALERAKQVGAVTALDRKST